MKIFENLRIQLVGLKVQGRHYTLTKILWTIWVIFPRWDAKNEKKKKYQRMLILISLSFSIMKAIPDVNIRNSP